MKRFLAILTVLALTLCFFSGCASNAGGNEEGAIVGDLVAGSSQENAGGNPEGPQKVENTLDPSTDDAGNTGNTNSGNADSGNTDAGNSDNNDTDKDQADTGNIDNETPGDEKTDEGDADMDEEPEAIDPDAEDSGYLKILSYNLRGLRNGPVIKHPNGDIQTTDVVRKNDVAQVIREINADFVGMQELELNRTRSGSFDHVPWLAKECGYEYYHFTQTVFDKSGDSGEGHGILSKYPIKDVKDVWYDSQDGEERKYCRVVLDVNGTDVVMYNTHLCTDNASDVNSVSASQFRQVLRAFYNEKAPTFLTADFNIVKETRSQIVDFNKGVIGLDGGPDQCFFNDKLHIDDIYVRNVAEVYADPDTQMSIFSGENMRGDEMPDVQPSDHIPCWGYVKLK